MNRFAVGVRGATSFEVMYGKKVQREAGSLRGAGDLPPPDKAPRRASVEQRGCRVGPGLGIQGLCLGFRASGFRVCV